MSSCPSTPDIALQQAEHAWDGRIQLEPSAISMLQQINTEEEHTLETVIEVPEEAISEMREIVESPRFALQLRTDDRSLEPSSAGDADARADSAGDCAQAVDGAERGPDRRAGARADHGAGQP